MLSIGISELIVILVIVAMLAVPIVVALVVILGKRKGQNSNAAAHLVQCSSCGRPVSPLVKVCPECGTPRV